MSNPEVRKKVKEVIRSDIGTFEQFDKVAHMQLGSLSKDLQEAVGNSLQNPEFKERYLDYLTAYEAAVKDANVASSKDLLDQDFIHKAKNNLQERGLKLHYKTDSEGAKELSLEIESEFLKAIGALISKLAGFF